LKAKPRYEGALPNSNPLFCKNIRSFAAIKEADVFKARVAELESPAGHCASSCHHRNLNWSARRLLLQI